MQTTSEKLDEMGITLPDIPAPPAGSYVPIVRAGNTLYVSGQIPIAEGSIKYTGKVSDNNIAQAQASARLCAINILAQIKSNLMDLERIEKIVSLTGVVNCASDFTRHPEVINTASDMLVEVFGTERGSHSRMAIGASSLPFDAMTEIGAVVLARD